MAGDQGEHGPRWYEGYELGLRDGLTRGMTCICDGGPGTLEMVDGYWAGRRQACGSARPRLRRARDDRPQRRIGSGLGRSDGPILATPPWRPGASRPPPVIAEAAADPHEHDWAGPGFTRPGPESNAGYRAGYALGTAEAIAGMTTIFDGPAASFTDGYINGHCQMTKHLAREASSREAEAG